MSLNKFDKDIKKKLEGFLEDYDDTSWERMASMLDDADLIPEAEDLEPIVKNKLSDHKQEFVPEHWHLLEEELDYIEARRQRLYVLKLAEAAILLLLLFTYWNYQRFHGTYDVQINKAYVEVVSGLDFSDEDINDIAVAQSSVDFDGTPAVFDRLEDKTSKLKVSHVPYLPEIPEAATNTSLTRHEETLSNLAVITKKPLDFAVERPQIIGNDNEPADEVVLKNLRPRSGWWVGVPVSYDLNVINTGFNFDYLTSHVNQGITGQSVGISVSFLYNNFEIESGVKYSDKTYAPGSIANYTKSSKNSFLESQLNAAHIRQIQIPVSVKLHAFNPGKSNLYVTAGVGFNAILDLDYSIRKTIQPSARVFTHDVSKAIIDLRKLPDGFAEGGLFRDNMYATAIIGLGFQTMLRDDAIFYFQPQYQYQFTNRLNTLLNTVHTLNIESGIRFKF